LNITDSKIFTIEGGILKYGNTSLSKPINYYFMIVNGTESASLYFSGTQIKFVSAMNSMVFILGGKVTLEYVIINQLEDTTNWVSPLVFSDSSISSVTIDLYSCIIENSTYMNANPSARSAIVHFANETTSSKSIVLNMSFCLCLNSTFNLSITNLGGGGVSHFCSYNESSCMCISFLIKKWRLNKKKIN
jgi:hypothetical protein